MKEGVIIQGRGGLYTVRDDDGKEYVLRAKKKFRRQGLSPLVGDRISFTPGISAMSMAGWKKFCQEKAIGCARR